MARLLILKAGSGASNNLIRSLKAGDPSFVIVGCHYDRFILKKSLADLNYIVSDAPEAFLQGLRRVIDKESIDLVIATSDADVLRISNLRGELPGKTFLPRKEVIELCQDKCELTTFLLARDIPAPLTYAISTLDEIEAIFERLAPRPKLWCRIRGGTGSLGAIPVTTPEQARSWIRYWEDMRNIRPGSFTLSEYLPGRDFCVQCLWKNGVLILIKMAERLVYIDSGSPSGVSSTPALAQTAFEPHVIEACMAAIRAIDPNASGVFFLDVKESEDGRPCITEINAGRFAAITNIHDLTGEHNMAATYARLALGQEVDIRDARDFAKNFYLVRSVDTTPAVISLRDLHQAISHWTD